MQTEMHYSACFKMSFDYSAVSCYTKLLWKQLQIKTMARFTESCTLGPSEGEPLRVSISVHSIQYSVFEMLYTVEQEK